MGSLDGLNGEFVSRLQAMQAAARAAGTSIGWGSGRRSVEQQIALRRKNGCPDVWSSPASSCRVPTAIPGRSNHNHGLAMDITGDKAWANANAARFGLHFPVRGENWHVEMIGDAGSRQHGEDAQWRGAIGFNMDWMDEPANPEDELTSRLDSVMKIVGGGSMIPEEIQSPDAGMEVGTDVMTIPAEAGGREAVGIQRSAGGFQGGVPTPGYVPPGEGAARWRSVAEAALRYAGEDPKWTDLLLRRMNQESGGNPQAVNNWDSNAARGDPSKGLMQNIGSAFNERARELSSRGIFDGFANIVASIRYTKQRYGSLQAWSKKGGY